MLLVAQTDWVATNTNDIIFEPFEWTITNTGNKGHIRVKLIWIVHLRGQMNPKSYTVSVHISSKYGI